MSSLKVTQSERPSSSHHVRHATPSGNHFTAAVARSGDPKALVPYEGRFTTFGPESIGGTAETFPSPGIVVLGERAYLVKNDIEQGFVRVFDL